MIKKRIDRREFLQVAAGAAAGLALSACGPAAPPVTEAPKAAPTEPPKEAAPAQGGLAFKGTLEFWDWDYTPRVNFTNQLVDEFQKANPGITLKYNPLPWTDIETKLLTVATAGSGPAFSNVHFFWRYDLQRAGVLAPYPDDMFDWKKLVSTPYNRDPETGKIYTSDFAFYSDMVFFNQELLDKEGIKPDSIPKRWDDFIAMAKQLTKKDANGKITQVGCSINDYWAREWLFHTLVYQQGGWMYNESATEALWNKDEGVKALQFIQDWYHVHQIDDPGFLAEGDAFGNEKAAMYIDQGYTATIDDNFPQMKGKWSTTTTPTFSGKSSPSSGMALPEEGFGVFNKFPVDAQQAAFAYIKLMLGSDERRIQWSTIMQGPPDRLDLLNDPRVIKGDTYKVIASQASTMPWRVIYGERPLEAEKFWRTMFDEVILNKGNVKAALDTATEQMNAAFKSSGKRRYIVERNFRPPSS
jgi:ABC-type glycerol-3-phosphate transport system substrate-binding protein